MVLLGAGHTHLEIIRRWGKSIALAGQATLTCVTNFETSTYSGMLPGVLAGQYPTAAMEVDLKSFCAACGVRLIVDDVVGLEHQHGQRQLIFHNRLPLDFDVLSVGIGSKPMVIGDSEVASTPIKPMQTFLKRLQRRLSDLETNPAKPWKIIVVGGGAGGVEIALCLPGFLKQHFAEQPYELAIVDGHDQLLTGLPGGAVRKVEKEFEQRGVTLHLGKKVTNAVKNASQHVLQMEDGKEFSADVVLWATGATGPPLLANLNLPTDERGFLVTKDTLQSTGDAQILAVGDSGSLESRNVPKAGVYAVRQAPVLWENLQRLLNDQPLKQFRPQGSFLKILNLGDGRAVLIYKGFSFRGRWCWWLKDKIDRGFMRKYQSESPLAET